VGIHENHLLGDPSNPGIWWGIQAMNSCEFLWNHVYINVCIYIQNIWYTYIYIYMYTGSTH
jgi:hypothetical protein